MVPIAKLAYAKEEVEICKERDINIYEKEEKSKYKHGNCTVTSLRLIWQTPHTVLCANLSSMLTVEKQSFHIGTRSGKIVITFNTNKDYIKLSFKAGGRDAFFIALEGAVNARDWEKSCMEDKRLEQRRQFCTKEAGVAGILRRQEMAQKKTLAFANTAFSELNGLMDKAKDMVAIIDRYVALQDKTSTDSDELDDIFLDMGIVNPVTKASAGAEYHFELARQLATFLEKPLRENDGILSLTDVYCRFNRARGVELISPQDLLASAELLQRARLGMHIHRFHGGLVVIQSGSILRKYSICTQCTS